MPKPIMTAETNSLPARKPSDIAEPAAALPSVFGVGFVLGSRTRSGPTFQFARQPIEPRPQGRGLVVAISGVRTHGAKPPWNEDTRRRLCFRAPRARMGPV